MEKPDRRRREFICAHHPDRGGDPDVFMAGLRRFEAESEQLRVEPLPRIVVVAHRAWLKRLTAALAKRARPGERVPRVQ